MSLMAAAQEATADATTVEWIRGLFALGVAVVTVGVPASLALLRSNGKKQERQGDAVLAWLAHVATQTAELKSQNASLAAQHERLSSKIDSVQADVGRVRERLGAVEEIVA